MSNTNCCHPRCWAFDCDTNCKHMDNTNEKAQSAIIDIENIKLHVAKGYGFKEFNKAINYIPSGIEHPLPKMIDQVIKMVMSDSQSRISQLESDLAKSQEKCSKYEGAMNRLTPLLSYFVGKFETVDVELNNFDKAMIERAEQALKPTDNV